MPIRNVQIYELVLQQFGPNQILPMYVMHAYEESKT